MKGDEPKQKDTNRRYNAVRHGILAMETILPGEDPKEYEALLCDLIDEYAPQGPTETHLVHEIAGIIWRTRRVRSAELAAHTNEMDQLIQDLSASTPKSPASMVQLFMSRSKHDALHAGQDQTDAELAVLEVQEAAAEHAWDIAVADRPNAYEKALKALPAPTKEYWLNAVATSQAGREGHDRPLREEVRDLLEFLEDVVFPGMALWRHNLVNRAALRNLAIGGSFDFDRLDRLARYEAHLDRRLQRKLSLLLNLQQLRQNRADTSSI